MTVNQSYNQNHNESQNSEKEYLKELLNGNMGQKCAACRHDREDHIKDVSGLSYCISCKYNNEACQVFVRTTHGD